MSYKKNKLKGKIKKKSKTTIKRKHKTNKKINKRSWKNIIKYSIIPKKMNGGSQKTKNNLQNWIKPLGKKNTIKLLNNLKSGGFIRGGSIQYFTAPCNAANPNRIEQFPLALNLDGSNN